MNKNISKKAIQGKNGFLYLGGPDSNDVISYFSGKNKIENPAIQIHEHNNRMLSRLKAPYSILVVPEAHIIYSEYLPDNICIVDDRPVNRILDIYKDNIIYPKNEFDALKNNNIPVYTGLDSHYTEFAAIQAYKLLRKKNGIEFDLSISYDLNVDNESKDLLSEDIDITAEKSAVSNQKHRSHFELIFSNGVRNNGSISVFVNNDAPLGRALCFGTSFSRHLIPAYCTDFKEVVFCYGTTIDDIIIDIIKPDKIFIEMPERFVHRPHLAVPGSVLYSHSLMANKDRFSISKKSSKLDLFITTLYELCNNRTIPKAILDLQNPALIRRLKNILEADYNLEERTILRNVLGGHYFRHSTMNFANKMIDNEVFADIFEILPQSEMGSFAKIRGYCRTNNLELASITLEQHLDFFGSSKAIEYYRKYLMLRV